MQTMQSPFKTGAVDLLFQIGNEHYTLGQAIAEYKRWGGSRKIPFGSIPKGHIPGVTRYFYWHRNVIPMVTAEGKTMADLTRHLVDKGFISQGLQQLVGEKWDPKVYLLPDDYVAPGIVELAVIIQDLPGKEYAELVKLFGIQWQGAVFMWGISGKPQIVVPKGEEPKAEHVAEFGDMVQYVNVDYDREWKNPHRGAHKQEGEGEDE